MSRLWESRSRQHHPLWAVREGQQRFRCKSCRKTFNARTGTLFHGRQTSADDILEVLALLAEGMRISSITCVKGYKEDTILDWLRATAQHAEQVEAVLLGEYRIGPAQIDGLWTYVGWKEKTKSVSLRMSANTGAAA